MFREEDGRVFSLAPPGEALRVGRRAVAARLGSPHRAAGELERVGRAARQHARRVELVRARATARSMWSYRAARPDGAGGVRPRDGVADRPRAPGAARARSTGAGSARSSTSAAGTGRSCGRCSGRAPGHARRAVRPARSSVEGVEGLEVAAGDFFESVPEGGDAYVLKHISPRLGGRRRRADPRVDSPRGAASGASVLVVDRDVGAGERGPRGEARRPEHARAAGWVASATAARVRGAARGGGFRYEGATPVLGAVRVFAGSRL